MTPLPPFDVPGERDDEDPEIDPGSPGGPDDPEGGFDPAELGEEALEEAVLADPDLEDDDLDEEDGEGEESEDGEGGDAKATKKASKKADDEEEAVEHPDTPVPTRKKMMSALEWAFEGEDDVTEELLGRFCDHALLLLKKNREMNLTAILDPKEIAAKHYLDSWRTTRLVPLMATRVLDLGSGGGFPGLPVAMAEPMCSMVLSESKQKKAGFLSEAVEALSLRNVTVVPERAEDFLTRERVDTVIVRAVSSVRENVRTLRKVRHALKDLVMLKAQSWSREVRAAEREVERLGFKLDTVWEHELPGEMGQRAILVYRAPGGAGL